MTMLRTNEYGIFADLRNTTRVDSRYIAHLYNRPHKDVVKRIEGMRRRGFSAEFCRENFHAMDASDGRGFREDFYGVARDGFLALTKDFLTSRDAEVTENYVKRLDQMDTWIEGMVSARREFPMLAKQIQLVNPEAQPYEYSNEADMINRIVIGMSANQYRAIHHLPRNADIRKSLNEHENAMLNLMQTMDIGLLVGYTGFSERRQQLTRFCEEWKRMLTIKAAWVTRQDPMQLESNKGEEHEN